MSENLAIQGVAVYGLAIQPSGLDPLRSHLLSKVPNPSNRTCKGHLMCSHDVDRDGLSLTAI